MSLVVGPDPDELLLGNVSRERHLLVGRRPSRVDILAHIEACFRLSGGGVHEQDLSAQERENGM